MGVGAALRSEQNPGGALYSLGFLVTTGLTKKSAGGRAEKIRQPAVLIHGKIGRRAGRKNPAVLIHGTILNYEITPAVIRTRLTQKSADHSTHAQPLT